MAGALLDTAIAEARRAGLLQIGLEMAEANVAAVRLYRRRGFQLSGRIPRAAERKSGFADDLPMVLRLDA
ncbi:MAG: GNAT family N-acetyltransferase [Alphaproteobacteria bacterium]|nr:GNAT family N-acetyltransferase [Alphaproteobacteria bacterium]